jgi:hypothetical protein
MFTSYTAHGNENCPAALKKWFGISNSQILKNIKQNDGCQGL